MNVVKYFIKNGLKQKYILAFCLLVNRMLNMMTGCAKELKINFVLTVLYWIEFVTFAKI